MTLPWPMTAKWSGTISLSLSTVARFSLSWGTAAADMGDVMQIKFIAEELMSELDVVAPFCDELIRLAEDFDFDGIQKIVLELN